MPKTTSDRRAEIRQGLHALYAPLYDGLCADLGPEWTPYYGKRSFMEQDRLYMQGRDPSTLAITNRKQVVTNAKAGESAHNWGCATDWTVFNTNGTPVWMTRKNPKWKEYQDVIEKHGLRWGGDWNCNGVSEEGEWDYFHNELHITQSWHTVLDRYTILKKGLKGDGAALDGAMRFIETLVKK